MNESIDARLLRHLAGELSDAAAAELERSLASDAALRTRRAELASLATTLRAVAGPRFRPGFADRVDVRVPGRVEPAGELGGPRFEPGFADRVMDRLESEVSDAARPAGTAGRLELDAGAALGWGFRRLAPVAAAAAIALGAFNLATATEAQTPLDAFLGLRPVTLESAYAMSALPDPSGAADSGGESR